MFHSFNSTRTGTSYHGKNMASILNSVNYLHQLCSFRLCLMLAIAISLGYDWCYRTTWWTIWTFPEKLEVHILLVDSRSWVHVYQMHSQLSRNIITLSNPVLSLGQCRCRKLESFRTPKTICSITSLVVEAIPQRSNTLCHLKSGHLYIHSVLSDSVWC